MEYPVIVAKVRPFSGKGYARKVRALGYIPAVLYSGGLEAQSLVVDPKVVAAVLNGSRHANTVVKLEIEDKDAAKTGTFLALVREYSVHPYRRTLEHCDFLKVDENAERTFRIPIHIEGKSEGEKLGAKLNIAQRDIVIRCLPADVPEKIEVDVSPLNVGEVLTLSQLPYPPKTVAVFDRDAVVVSVRMPRAEVKEETPEAVEGEGAAVVAEGAEGAAAAGGEAKDAKAEDEKKK